MILSVFRVAPKQAHRGANGAFYDQVLGCLTLNYLKIGSKSYSLFMWIEGIKAKRIDNKKNQTNAIRAIHGGKLFAVGLFDSKVNSDVFYFWVDQFLLPELPTNSVIVMDNAGQSKT